MWPAPHLNARVLVGWGSGGAAFITPSTEQAREEWDRTAAFVIDFSRGLGKKRGAGNQHWSLLEPWKSHWCWLARKRKRPRAARGRGISMLAARWVECADGSVGWSRSVTRQTKVCMFGASRGVCVVLLWRTRDWWSWSLSSNFDPPSNAFRCSARLHRPSSWPTARCGSRTPLVPLFVRRSRPIARFCLLGAGETAASPYPIYKPPFGSFNPCLVPSGVQVLLWLPLLAPSRIFPDASVYTTRAPHFRPFSVPHPDDPHNSPVACRFTPSPSFPVLLTLVTPLQPTQPSGRRVRWVFQESFTRLRAPSWHLSYPCSEP